MGLYRTFTHVRVVAPVPRSLRQWIAAVRADAPPFGDWLTDLQIVFQDVRGRDVDLDRAVMALHDLAPQTGPVRGRIAGSEAIPRGEDFALALTIDLEPEVAALGRVLAPRPVAWAEASAIVPATAHPHLTLIGDLATPFEAAALRRAIATAPTPEPFPIDRVQILATSGRAGWWSEVTTVHLGKETPHPDLDRPILRHAGGWRLAG